MQVKLPGGGAVQRLALMREAGVLAVAASRRLQPARPRLPEEAGGDTHASAAYAGSTALAELEGEDLHEVRGGRFMGALLIAAVGDGAG